MAQANPRIEIHGICPFDDDTVVQLREWGTQNTHVLPVTPNPQGTLLGRHRSCAIRLLDPSKRVSRVHAALLRDGPGWVLRDMNSTNGIFLHGVRVDEARLHPGDEIQVGYLTLVAESRRTIALRAYLSRLLGWEPGLLEIVDLALRSIRASELGGGTLVLCGEDDLIPIARAIHQRTLGRSRPFIVCDPARCQVNDLARSPENYDEGRPALDAAVGGTLCVRHERLPQDFPEVAAALRAGHAQARLIVCARTTKYCARYLSLPITIPPLGDRGHELDRLIDEYAQDGMEHLGLSQMTLPVEDHAWVRIHASSSIAAIEKACLRLAAIRTAANLAAAAAQLGMSESSLARWIDRRKVPMGVVPSCCETN